jgi:preprotein translocase subunit SecA
MDHLKEGIGLRGYGQHDPLVEYKRESFDMFEEMMKKFQEETARYLYLMQILERPADGGGGPEGGPGGPVGGPGGVGPQGGLGAQPGVPVLGGNGGSRPPRHIATSVDDLEEAFQRKKRRELEQARMAGGGEQKTVQQVVRGADKVGRNDPCPCGSGKKYKKCHGA